MVYVGYKVVMEYEDWKADFLGSIFLTMLFFVLSNFIVMHRAKSMYSEVLKNMKLSNEMKKVLKSLPFGVLIKSSSEESQLFSNKEFNEKICKLNKGISDLANIDVIISGGNKKSQEGKEIKTHLDQFLRHQESCLKGKSFEEIDSIKIL